MAVITGSSFGTAVYLQSHCLLCGSLKIKNEYHQQRITTHKFKVHINSTLPTNSVFFSYYKHRATRRRNLLGQKLAKALDKPQIVAETNESSETNLGNFEPPNEEDKSKVDKTGDTKGTSEISSETNVQEPYNINRSQSISEEYLKYSTSETKLINVTGQSSANETSKSDPEVPTSSPKKQKGKMWDEWKDWYQQSQKDMRTWGVGKAPIFLVYESGDGKVKVYINEKEINNRFGSLPFLGNEARVLLGEKLAQAKQLAREIETGAFKPPRNSSAYEFISPDKSDLEKKGFLESYVFSGVSSVIGPAPPLLKVSVVGFYVLSCSLFLWVAWKYIFSDGPFWEEEHDEDRLSLEGEDKTDDKIFSLGLENKKIADKEAELRKKELGVELSSTDALGMKKRILQIQDIARQALSYYRLILRKIIVHYGSVIKRLEFEKWILQIRNMARQALAFFVMFLCNKSACTKKHLNTDNGQDSQDITRQVHGMEQNRSDVFSQHKEEYSNSETLRRNVNDGRGEGNQPSSSSMARGVDSST